MLILKISGLIGDSVLKEPALFKLGQSTNQKIPCWIQPNLRPLFAGHSFIESIDDCPADAQELSCSEAMRWASHFGQPFAAGYFGQLGLPVEPGDRLHFRLFAELPPVVAPADIAFATFARSCSGNIRPPDAFWDALLERLGQPVLSLGAADDPELPGTINVRGMGLLDVAGLLANVKVLVSVETGLLHLANACCQRVVFLSSATPIHLCKPICPHVEVVRAFHPSLFSVDDTLSAINRLLAV
jgi:ADP-heptose:LPS heptosyltransferase